ncbi:hypothetical protein SAMN05444396_105229 [Flavobacterium segetis]|uniref:Outermembrane protein n=1 Tax=Flavobacterium segetis TaxID=271157 RepID=A0A1M5HPB8_9FLAO|nr:hypothetical protein [Flavobacterium segetis]SHG17804.1 hypothetical protein SAMN05444396_105229 [Flavobacterium segetis]
MKSIFHFLAVLLTLSSACLSAQENIKLQEKYTDHNKGKFFVSWGGNRDNYSKSDITFKGKDYNFTIENVTANDKPKGWHVDYINPARMTIPQTNFKLGYFISDKYSVAIGMDHMKYVMAQDKAVTLNGFYPNPGTYDELLPNNQILLTEKFLTFEHTDGLNYVHTEISRHDDISSLFNLANIDKVQINLTEGIGVGVLYPKTNAMLLGKQRHDDWHISGFGTSLKAGLNVTFFKHFYIQGELKGGYINMQDIRTTQSTDDTASQDFFFFQRIIAFGGIFKI